MLARQHDLYHAASYAGGMNDIHSRLRDARFAAGFKSASEAARSHGWPASTYIAHENGQNAYTQKHAHKYAKAFKTKAKWLLLGDGEQDSEVGIDAQLRMMDPDLSRELIQRFNGIIEGVKLAGKLK
jgi:hypothetical protein